MSVIAGLQDFRQGGAPADIGTFLVPTTILIFRHTFSGTTYTVSVRSGERGWVLIDLLATTAANNVTVINNAITYVSGLGGGEVHLSNQIYTINASIVMLPSVWLSGEWFYRNPATGALSGTVLYLADASNVEMIGSNIQVNWNIKITDIALDGNLDNQTTQTLAGIHIVSPIRCAFRDLLIQNTRGDGITVGNHGDPGVAIGFNNVYDSIRILNCESTNAAYGYGIYEDYCDENFYSNIITDCANNANSKGYLFGAGLDVISNVWVIEATIGFTIPSNNNILVSCGSDESRSQGLFITGNSNSVDGFQAYFCNRDDAANDYAVSFGGSASLNILVGIVVYSEDRRGAVGIDFGGSTLYNTVTGFSCTNNESDVNIAGTHNFVSGGVCYDPLYNGVNLRGSANGCGDVTVYSAGQYGIWVNNGDDAVIKDCTLETCLTGIYITDGDDTVISDTRFLNCTTGINVDRAAAVRPRMFGNFFKGCTTNVVFAAATNPIFETVTFQFTQGGSVEGTSSLAEFISATASAKGWRVDGGVDWGVATGQLPPKLQEIMRITIRAVALGAPIGAGGQMHLEIIMNAGADNLAFNTEPVALANFDGVTTDYIANDGVHWSIASSDDADIGHMVAGMSIEVKVIYEAGADPDGATNAVFRCVEIEYI